MVFLASEVLLITHLMVLVVLVTYILADTRYLMAKRPSPLMIHQLRRHSRCLHLHHLTVHSILFGPSKSIQCGSRDSETSSFDTQRSAHRQQCGH